MSTTTNPEGVAVAAERLAEAEIAAEGAAAAHREADAHDDRIRAKIAGLDDARRAIGTRRAAGDLRSTDGAELALIAADHEGLTAMRAEHEGALAAARAAAEDAARALDAARFALGREEDRAEERALTEHLDRLDALLRETIVRANWVARRLGRSRPAWAPSRETMDLLHPLHHGRAWL
jgi:hypothetical protein